MYQDENTRWLFTVPQAGEVDSVEAVEKRVREIDKAILGPMEKAELLSHGKKLNPKSFVDGDRSTYSDTPDEYWSTIKGEPIYTTESHYHPIPSVVLRSNQATNASYAASADKANQAGYLSPGFTINGMQVTGRDGQSVTIKVNDIPDAPRVFWGSNDPENASIGTSPRKGDIYVRVR